MEETPDFGKCLCARGHLQSRHVEVRMPFRGRTLTLPGVLQGKCPECGTTVYRPQTLGRLETIYLEGKEAAGEDLP
jgi:hypothetical protein